MQFIQPKNRKQIEMVSLEMAISPDNEVRVIDAFIDSMDIKKLGFETALAP